MRPTPRHRALLTALFCTITPALARAADPQPAGPAILQDLKSFQQMATVLLIAAHPDDENTQLITYLARGRGYRMGYLSVTRGDGGQNVLGPEFGEELGLIRTNELLAARSLDLGRQYFTRAIDFGYSKTPDETLRIWDRDAVLGDVVRVIRQFRPDVVVVRFSPTGTNTHGHHTASAILAVDAFKICGDPKAYPEQLKEGLTPWQPKRLLLNAGAAPGQVPGGPSGGLRIDAGGTDPVLNETYAAISAQSRAMHKTQGFGAGGAGGGGGRGGAGGPSYQLFSLLAGEPATTDIMDGIDTTWARVSGTAAAADSPGKQIATLTADAIAKFDPKNPDASVPALLAVKKLLDALPITAPTDPILAEKRELIDRLIANCLGLTIQTTVPNADVTPDEILTLHCAVAITSAFPVKWATSGDPMIAAPTPNLTDLHPGQIAVRDVTTALDSPMPVSQPYWLRAAPATGIFRVADAYLIGRPMNPPVHPFTYSFQVGDQHITLSDEPVQLIPNAPTPQQRRPLSVIAPVALTFTSQVTIFTPGKSKSVDVEVTAYRPNLQGNLQINAPAGWTITTFTRKNSQGIQPFKLAAIGDHAKLTFTVTPPNQSLSSTFTATATIGAQTYSTGHKEIIYDHLPRLLLQPQAQTNAVTLDLAIKGKSIAYLPGAGDSVADCIAQMGYTVTQLKTADLTADNLAKFDALVLGVRAFNTHDDLTPTSPALKAIFDYAANGGTVVEQYNRPDGPGGTNTRATSLAPFPIHLSTLRVTDETAAVKFLAPDHPALNTPNKITAADFDNWVQERSIYLPDQWDASFTPILGAADPGESPPNSALLIAHTGQGYFVYTSLVFFRQLPAGNPGTYRLFANLISLGK